MHALPLQQVKDARDELREGKADHRVAEESCGDVYVPWHAFGIDGDAQLALLLRNRQSRVCIRLEGMMERAAQSRSEA